MPTTTKSEVGREITRPMFNNEIGNMVMVFEIECQKPVFVQHIHLYYIGQSPLSVQALPSLPHIPQPLYACTFIIQHSHICSL